MTKSRKSPKEREAVGWQTMLIGWVFMVLGVLGGGSWVSGVGLIVAIIGGVIWVAEMSRRS